MAITCSVVVRWVWFLVVIEGAAATERILCHTGVWVLSPSLRVPLDEEGRHVVLVLENACVIDDSVRCGLKWL